MPRLTHVRPKKRRVVFVPHASVQRFHEDFLTQAAVRTLNYQISDSDINLRCATVELGSLDVIDASNSTTKIPARSGPRMAGEGGAALPSVPGLFTTWPSIRDELETETSESQDETVQECLPFLNGSVGSLCDYNACGLPSLARDKHIQFLHRCLGTLPAAFVSFDAARPWIVYWVLTALSLLEEDVEQYRGRYLALAVVSRVAILKRAI